MLYQCIVLERLQVKLQVKSQFVYSSSLFSQGKLVCKDIQLVNQLSSFSQLQIIMTGVNIFHESIMLKAILNHGAKSHISQICNLLRDEQMQCLIPTRFGSTNSGRAGLALSKNSFITSSNLKASMSLWR